MKTCRVCETAQPLSHYSVNSSQLDGKNYRCKTCDNNRHKTYGGKLKAIYSSQRATSLKRKHPPPAYTLVELTAWAEKNGYCALYQVWQTDKYTRYTAPSVDRLDDHLPYTLSNIRLVTWKTNETKSHVDMKAGKIITHHTAVNQLSLVGELIATHISQAAAARALGIFQGNIHQAMNPHNPRKSAGGFKWEYSNE